MRYVCLVLCLVLVCFSCAAVSAAEAPVQTGANIFKVSVPTSLPVVVDSDNNVTVASSAEIINHGNVDVEIDSAVIEPADGWSLTSFDKDFTKFPVNTKEYGFRLNGEDCYNKDHHCLCDMWGVFDVIPAGESLSFTYDANVAIQSDWYLNWNIGEVVFTVCTSDSLASTGMTFDDAVSATEIVEPTVDFVEKSVSEETVVNETQPSVVTG